MLVLLPSIIYSELFEMKTLYMMDTPKSLGNTAMRLSRMEMLAEEHISPLVAFVHDLRSRMGETYCIPYFDPLDGGIEGSQCFANHCKLGPPNPSTREKIISRAWLFP